MVKIHQRRLKKQVKNSPSQPVPQPRGWRRDEIKHGQRWGRWRFNQENLTLTLEATDGPFDPTGGFFYEIDVEKCGTPAQMLDWIFQMEAKIFVTDKDLSDLVRALNVLLYPQATLCSFGHPKKLDVRGYLRACEDQEVDEHQAAETHARTV